MHMKIIGLLKNEHKADLNLKENVYYLYLKDAQIAVYIPEDTTQLKIDIEMIPEGKTFVYRFDEISIGDLMK